MRTIFLLVISGLVLLPANLSAAILYVSQRGSNPMVPYASWATAATNIQDAADAAGAGDLVLVTNGLYAIGGGSLDGLVTNRVVISAGVELRSVSGPALTVIAGAQGVRCAYVGTNAVLNGFLLTNGYAATGGGAWCELSAVVTNCAFNGNVAEYDGGGAYGGTLSQCSFYTNTGYGNGGGAASGTLNHCTFAGNHGGSGGGAANATLNYCTVSDNFGMNGYGGGTFSCTLNNCVLTGNQSTFGGGSYGGALTNCTLVGNGALFGGGASSSVMNNCIVYFNSAGDGNYNNEGSSVNYSCLTPLLPGVGNIALDPQFVDLAGGDFRLEGDSPCINAGNNASAAGTSDLDGNPRISGGTVDMGAYEFVAVGPPFITQEPQTQTALLGSDVTLSVTAAGALPLYWQWFFNTNPLPTATHRTLTLTAVTTNAAGVYWVIVANALGRIQSELATLTVSPDVNYVCQSSPNPTPPFATWDTAAHQIQDAVDAQVPGGLVLVTNGTYASGGKTVAPSRVVNRVVVDKPITLQSLNGPAFTLIDAFQTPDAVNGNGFRGVYLTNGATLSGFTVTNGAAEMLSYNWVGELSGGGVWCASSNSIVTNCVLAGNTADYAGGGAYGGTLIDCLLFRNRVMGSYTGGNSDGGAASSATLLRCTVSDNRADGQFSTGGGAYGSTLLNCTLTNNSSAYTGGGASGSAMTNCVLAGNSAANGGGAYGGTLDSCLLSTNFAGSAGGVAGGLLYNCILTGNTATSDGGGAGGGTILNNCTLVANTAQNGGAARYATMNNCTLARNNAQAIGGGLFSGTLNNCLVISNSCGTVGGGAADAYLNNCTVVGNTDGVFGNAISNSIVYDNLASNYSYCIVFNSCTLPVPGPGFGNFSNAPLFVDEANGNFRLQSNSPCINAGNNAAAPGPFDLDGNPRIVGGTVDVGAYEFQFPTSRLSYAWLQSYGLPTDGSADFIDTDGDGMNNWQEWLAGTDPTNALSALRMIFAAPSVDKVTVTWQSVFGINYFLERSTNTSPANTLFEPAKTILVGTNIPGQDGVTAFTDTNASGPGPFFYRVGVPAP